MFRVLLRKTNLVIIFTGLLIFWLSQREWLPNLKIWKKAEGALIDARYVVRGARRKDPNIVLIGIETSSFTLDRDPPEEIQASPTLQLMSQPYPWNRGVYAAVLDKVMKAGAKVVVFDFVFANHKEGDDAFAEMVSKYHKHVVLASMIEPTEETYLPPGTNILRANLTNVIGLVNVGPDEDGICRRGHYRTSLERETPQLKQFAGDKSDPDDLIALSALAVQKFAGNVKTPPYDRDNFIDFDGPGGTYRPLPIQDLFVDKLWNNPPINGATAFRNKIVVVGPIANILHDIHSTPLGEMPGPELQIQMMSTLLRDSSLIELSPLFETWLTFGMVFVALAICMGIQNALLKPVLMICTVIGFLLVCQSSFTYNGVVVEMMPPLFTFVGAGSLGILLQFTSEQFERRRYRNILERYVSKGVAKKILDDKRSFVDSLNGQRKSLTVLFSDIRGFTTMTEKSDPEHLVKQLNEYFHEMVGAVLKEKGSLQKFIGDAIMAAWGDVRTDGAEEDARHAVSTALQMRAALIKLNTQWETQPDRKPLRTGIGINTGEVIVGNIGHPQRMEFTVLGDGVNLAARMESATKQFHVDLLVGESVEALTRKHFVFRKVGLLAFMGKTRGVEVFTVLGDRKQSEPAWLGRYHEAVQLFRNRQFAAAENIFRSVLAEIGAEDFLCESYADRSAVFQKEPPPEDWNGTLILTEK